MVEEPLINTLVELGSTIEPTPTCQYFPCSRQMDGRDWAVCSAGGFPMPWSWPFRENQPIPGGDQARSPAAGWPGFRGIRPGDYCIYIHLAVLYIYICIMVIISRTIYGIYLAIFFLHTMKSPCIYDVGIYWVPWNIRWNIATASAL